MRNMMKRGLVAGAIALTISVPVGAYAAVGSLEDTPDTTDTETWTPPRQARQDCTAPEEIQAILDSPELQALRAEHQAEARALREERWTTRDPETRDAFRADMTALRDEHRAEIAAKLADEPEALAWLEEHWATSPAQGMGMGMGMGQRGGFGQGAGYGQGGNGAAIHQQEGATS